MQVSHKATKINHTKKRLSFNETKAMATGNKRGKQWQRTNKRAQVWEEV